MSAHATTLARIEADLADHALVPLEWYDLLVAIQLAPRSRLRMRDLADALLLTRSNATRLVDRLEASGLVARAQAEEDRRGAVALLTPAGRQALRRAWPVYARGINEYFLSFLAPKEQKLLTAALSRVEGGARSATRPPGAAPR